MINPKIEATQIALNNLFSDNRFSICTIDNLIKLNNTIPDNEAYKILSAIHCCPYAEMSNEFRTWLIDVVFEMFEQFDNLNTRPRLFIEEHQNEN